MSWMDSWSRPSKSQATPPPFYLLPGAAPKYCKSCGRIVGRKAAPSSSSKAADEKAKGGEKPSRGGGGGEKTKGGKEGKVKENATPPAYCSVKCRARKPGVVDRRIEECFVRLLRGEEWDVDSPKSAQDKAEVQNASSEETHKSMKNGKREIGSAGYKGGRAAKPKKKKGENRILVMCDEVERLVFDRTEDPEKQFGRRKNRARRGVKDGEWKSVDMEEGWVPTGGVRGIRVLVDSDGEARDVPGHNDGESGSDNDSHSDGDSGEEPGHDEHDEHDSGAKLSTSESETSTLDAEKLARLEASKDLKGWLSTNHTTTKLQSTAPTTDTAFQPTISQTTEPSAETLAALSIRSGTRIRPPQSESAVNGSLGGEKGVKERIVENDEMLVKRREGQRRAEEREQVRCAARRLVAFGWKEKTEKGEKERNGERKGEEEETGEERLLCEAVMKGEVVESSFAKGDWGVRWRE